MTDLSVLAMLLKMRIPSILIGLFVLLPALITSGTVVAASDPQDEITAHANESWSGDLGEITERRFLRILTVHNPLFFTFEGAKQKGMVADLAKMFEDQTRNQFIACYRNKWLISKNGVPVTEIAMPGCRRSSRGDKVSSLMESGLYL